MAINNQLSALPVQGGDVTLHNYGGSDIAAGSVVLFDGSNAQGINQGNGIVLPSSSGNPAGCVGITLEVVKTLKDGRVRVLGGAQCTADGSINFMDPVMPSTTGGKLGRVTKATGAMAIGYCFSQSCADGDPLIVWLTPAGSGLTQVGSAVLVGGTVTVNTGIALTSNSKIVYARSTTGGTPGHLSYVVNATGAFSTASITFNSSSGTDTSTIVFEIIG